MEEQIQITEKKSKAWVWILVILIILIIGGVIAWFILSGDGGSSLIPGGSSVPQPPALPSN
jgi:flagellar basal body-associated protein FliL